MPIQRGIALVIVLWMLVLLTVIANNLVFSSRTEISIAANLASRARAETLADAGVHLAIHQLAAANPGTAANEPGRLRADGLTRAWRFDDVDLLITIIDEGGKVDLNTAPALLLSGLFGAVGIEPTVAEALADVIVDWRDADDLRQLHGAEKDDYIAAGRDAMPSNMNFESIDELRQVLGMNDLLFSRVERFITVNSRKAGVNTATAAREVLLAFPGTSPEQVDLYIEQRRALLEQGLPAPPFSGGTVETSQPLGSGTTTVPPSAVVQNAAYSIEVLATLTDNSRFLRQASVRLTGIPNSPVAFLAWRAPAPDKLQTIGKTGALDSVAPPH